MKVTSLSIPDLLLIEPEVFEDSRGFFFESFNQVGFEKATNISPIFVQENHSKSTKGVLRGLHYQVPPMAQDKLVRVIQGEIFDIAVDIRLDSPTFGQWVSEILSDKNKKQLWVPKGFAHGFLVVSESAEVVYKTSDVYVPKCERCICWNDPKIAVDWPLDNINLILSDKDKKGVLLENSEIF